jgi:hypothetical protein
MIDLLHRFIIPAAYSILPPVMANDRATAMLIAIALQESDNLTHRKQVRGPARGWLQFERTGIAGVLAHPRSRIQIANACDRLKVRATIEACYPAVEQNDVLMMAFGRCLLYTLPDSLPGPTEHARAWTQYLSAWRPGKPHPATWQAHYTRAWATVLGVASAQEQENGSMYSPKFNHLKDEILLIAKRVKEDFPRDWDALSRKDTTYIRRVAWACREEGFHMVALNGKRGNTDDLSSDVLAFPNPTGCRDHTRTHPGLELHDIIFGVEDPAKRKLTWGDSTQETIDNDVAGAWVEPEPVDDSQPNPTPTPSGLPHRGEAMEAGRWLDSFYASREGLQRPEGLSIGGRPDWEGVGAWLFDVWLKARMAGKSEPEARQAVVAAIQATDEWKRKHGVAG